MDACIQGNENEAGIFPGLVLLVLTERRG